MHDVFHFVRVAGLLLMVVIVVGSWLSPNRAKKALRKAAEVAVDSEEQVWADGLRERHGEFLAKETFAKVAGLRGYAPVAAWQRLLGFYSGARMEVIVARTGLLFFDPAFQSTAKLTVVPAGEIQTVRTDYNNGSKLILRTNTETVLCDTGRQMGAKAIVEIIRG